MSINKVGGIMSFIRINPNVVKSIVSSVVEVANILDNYQKGFGHFSEKAAEKGWFVTSHTNVQGMVAAYNQGEDSLDKFMEHEIESNFEEIRSSIISANQNRAHILNPAFEFHLSEQWVASIPLLLAQTDGIFAKKVGAYLFSEHEKRKSLILEKYGQKGESFIPYMCTPFEVETQFSASIGSQSAEKKKRGPNRNGILHGSSRHLDYATKINSLKCISLLSYIAMFIEVEST